MMEQPAMSVCPSRIWSMVLILTGAVAWNLGHFNSTWLSTSSDESISIITSANESGGDIITLLDPITELKGEAEGLDGSQDSNFTILQRQYGFRMREPSDARFKTRQGYHNGIAGTISTLPPATARLVVIKNFPVCEWTNFCLRRESNGRVNYFGRDFTLLPSDEAERKTNRSIKQAGCNPGHSSYHNYIVNVSKEISLQNHTGEDRVVFLPAGTFLIDTYVLSPHYDHVGAKAIQFFHLREESFFNQTFMFTQSRYPSERRAVSLPLTQLVQLSMGPRFFNNTEQALTRLDLENYGTVCMERAYEVRRVSERIFGSTKQIPSWVSTVDRFMGRNANDCPDVSSPVLLLERREGQGQRRILNFDIDGMDVLRELGVVCLGEKIFRPKVSQDVPLLEQARIFRNASLVISSRGSQLRNSIFSHPLSAVIEIRPHEGEKYDLWARYPSPFCVARLCVNHYAVSLFHDDNAPPGYRVDYNISKSIFKRDLQNLLNELKASLQARNCPLHRIFDVDRCSSANRLLGDG